MTIPQYLDRAKAELAQAYVELEHAQRQMQAAQGHMQQCEIKKVCAEARVEAYARVLSEKAQPKPERPALVKKAKAS